MTQQLRDNPAAAKLSWAIQLRTVSFLDPSRIDQGEFSRWESFLRDQFPTIHSRCSVNKLSDLAYVFKLDGSNPELSPIAFHAHFDVVPADDSPGIWTYPPFAGAMADGQVWGRGAIDEKGLLVTLWQALEELLLDGFVPQRTLFFCLGGDEEVGGERGAKVIAEYFAREGIRLDGLLDEGAFVVSGLLPGRSGPVALIGIAEKGYVNVRVSAEGRGGHSSMPPRETAVGLLGRAVAQIERRPFPLRITPSAAAFFRGLARIVGFPLSFMLSRPFLFAPLLKAVFSRGPQTAALLRTTQAPTILRAGSAENVLADHAEAVINIRLLHGNTADDAVRWIRRSIADRRVSVDFLPGSDRSDAVPPTDPDSWFYRRLVDSIRSSFPDAPPVPFLVTGMTDSKHYRDVCSSILRFVPFRVDSATIATMHNVDERVSLENLKAATAFYKRLLVSCSE
ncbi:MAG TPA: M20/M25/M40 family metallo-hydrolase [Spirochaetia bacterium]|nr:M20/M25/M40 family metallo-hydrolase [Spirochaetia bacterium]